MIPKSGNRFRKRSCSKQSLDRGHERPRHDDLDLHRSVARRMATAGGIGVDRAGVDRARGARDRAQRVLRTGLRPRRGAGVRRRRRRRPGVVADPRSRRSLPGPDRAPLWSAAAGVDRLDPSLWAARHTAGRSRCRRGGARCLARSRGRRPDLARRDPVAAHPGGPVRARARHGADATPRRHRLHSASTSAHCSLPPAHGRIISSTRSEPRSARSCGGNAIGSPTSAP